MAAKTLRIELKTDFDDDSKFELIKSAAKAAAKTLITTAHLIKDKRNPSIAITSEDLFIGQEDIEINYDGGEDAPQD